MWLFKKIGSIVLAAVSGCSAAFWLLCFVLAFTEPMEDSRLSGFVICVLLFVLSVFLTYKAVKTYQKPVELPEAQAAMQTMNNILGLLMTIFGGCIVFFFGLGLIFSLDGTMEKDITLFIVGPPYTLAGVFLISRGKKLRHITLPAKPARPTKMKAVTCENCGAPAKVEKGTVAQCEYCGGYIQG